eukprot:1916564-Rhodomonas_salina.1
MQSMTRAVGVRRFWTIARTRSGRTWTGRCSGRRLSRRMWWWTSSTAPPRRPRTSRSGTARRATTPTKARSPT